MFSVITNIYNKKTKGLTLIELSTATGKLKKLLLITRDIRCAHHKWHSTHRYNIQVFSAVNGRPLDFCLHIHPVSVNCLNHPQMVLSVGGSFPNFARNACFTVTTDLLVSYSNPQNDFSPGAAIFSPHTLAWPSSKMWTTKKNNLLGKKILSCSSCLYSFRKYVFYGFPIKVFVIPECIMKHSVYVYGVPYDKTSYYLLT
jgi:hypothetical protein